MATYNFHRLMKGKVKIDIFFCLNGDIWNLFLQKCLLSSPQKDAKRLHMSFVQIADFDWLQG